MSANDSDESIVEVISDVNEQMAATVNIANEVITQSLYDDNAVHITDDPNYEPSMEEISSSSDEQSIERQNSGTPAGNTSSEGTLTKEKRSLNSYSVKTKLETINKYYNKFNQNKNMTSKMTGIPRTTIICWIKEEKKTKEFAEKCKQKHFKKSIRNTRKIKYMTIEERQAKAKWPKMEEKLYEWFKEQRRKRYPVTEDRLIFKANEIFAEVYPEMLGKFIASRGWMCKFNERHRISRRVRTGNGQKIPNNAGDLCKSFISFTSNTISNYKISDSCVGAADEVPLYFDDSGNYTYEHIGEKHVLIESTGYDHMRYTVMISYMADGTKLKPFIIFGHLKKVQFSVPLDN